MHLMVMRKMKSLPDGGNSLDEKLSKVDERTEFSKECFKCRFCKKLFNHSEKFREHQLHHNADRSFVCRFCSKIFTTSSNLYTHERIHSGVQPFECQFCKKTFSRTGHLRRHELIHTGEKPFECRFCKKNFAFDILAPQSSTRI